MVASREVLVANEGNEPVTFDVTVVPNRSIPGVDVEAQPATVTVPPPKLRKP
jgi:hypothetical protein